MGASNPRWKKFERQVARAHGGQRRPSDGTRGGSDVRGVPLFEIQVKFGYKVPAPLRAWVDGIASTAAAAGKVGIVVWKEKGDRPGEALVVLRYPDWLDLHGAGDE